MPLTLWNQDLIGNKVPAGHSFTNVINLYSTFRNTIDGNLVAFGNWIVEVHGFAPGGVNAFCYPLKQNQLNIAALNPNEVSLLANDPQGRFARIFLYQWYRCSLETEFPRCLADVFIVGCLRGQPEELQGQNLNNRIVDLGYAGNQNVAGTLIYVGNGIGRHFGFLDKKGLPTTFFNSYFQ